MSNVTTLVHDRVACQKILGKAVREAIEDVNENYPLTFDDIVGILHNISFDYYMESRGNPDEGSY